MNPHHLALTSVSFTYPHRSRPALRDINLTLDPHELVGLVGPNGSGKSTLLKLIVGPEAIGHARHHGQIALHGRESHRADPTWRARQLAYVPQQITPDLPFTVAQMIRLGRHPHQHGGWSKDTEGEQAIASAMERCDVVGLKDTPVGELSGGERQRVLLASALAQQTPTLMLDEPTSALDLQYALNLLALLRDLVDRDGLSVLMASHDLNLTARYCTRVVVLHEGKCVADGPPHTVITQDLLASVYGVDARIAEIPDYPAPVVLPLGPLGG